MRVLRTDVLKELQGTYFTQDHRDTLEESESIAHMITGQHLKSSTTDRDLTICKGHRGYVVESENRASHRETCTQA